MLEYRLPFVPYLGVLHKARGRWVDVRTELYIFFELVIKLIYLLFFRAKEIKATLEKSRKTMSDGILALSKTSA